MKPALALEPVHRQGEAVGHIRRLAVLALKMDAARPKSAPAKIVADVGLARGDKNPGVAEGAISE